MARRSTALRASPASGKRLPRSTNPGDRRPRLGSALRTLRRRQEGGLAMKYVDDFDEPCDGGRALLGGKGLGLAEMTQLGLPVPPGFTITTEACRATSTGGELPARPLPEGFDPIAPP